MLDTVNVLIHLDSADRQFRPGETVEGTIHVHTDRRVKCDRLVVECWWETNGVGTYEESGQPESLEIVGPVYWRKGEHHRYRFSLPLPCGPCSYDGELFNVDWWLRARAEVGTFAGFDPVGTTDLTVVAQGDSLPGPYFNGPSDVDPQDDLDRVTALQVMRHLGGLVVVGGFIAIAFAMVWLPYQEGMTEVGQLAPFAAFGVLVLGFAGYTARQFWFAPWIADRKLWRHLTIDIGDRKRALGGSLEVTIRPDGREEVAIQTVELTLRGREIVFIDSNRWSVRIRTHDVFSAYSSRDLVKSPGDGSPAEARCQFELPSGAPPSFCGEFQRLQWSLQVKVKTDGGSDYETDVPIEVLPTGR